MGKLLKLLLLLSGIFLSALPQKSEISDISTAISEVVKEFYQKEEIKFDIISYASKSQLYDEVGLSVIRNIQGVPYQLFELSQKLNCDFKINQSAILLFESFASFNMFVRKERVLDDLLWKPLHFLVYYPNASVEQVAKLTYNRITQFRSFIFNQNGGDYDLMCVTRFLPGKCDKTEVVNINRFSRKSKKWTTSNFFPQPQRDFHACNISIGARFNQPFNIYTEIDGTGTYKFQGVNIDLMNVIAKHHNFNVIYIPGHIFLDPKTNVSFDLSLLTQPLSLKTLQRSYITDPYYFGRLTVLVPSGDAYTSFEKLILPFDGEIWFWLVITFATAFITILIVNFMPKFVQNFVFGRNILTPSLNVWVVFCGLSFVKLPGRNFARFILTNFIIFSLIIRTAYQAKMYQLMQLHMTKREVQSLDEMRERNLPLFSSPGNYYHYDGFKALEG